MIESGTSKRNPKTRWGIRIAKTLMVYLKTTKWQPPQWWPLTSFYRRKGWGTLQKERPNIPFLHWGIFALILGGEIDGALSPSSHTHTLCPLLTTPVLHVFPLVYMCMCTFNTLHFTLPFYICFLNLILQVYQVHVQCCTSPFYLSHSECNFIWDNID